VKARTLNTRLQQNHHIKLSNLNFTLTLKIIKPFSFAWDPSGPLGEDFAQVKCSEVRWPSEQKGSL
jgi:hypothetical protein